MNASADFLVELGTEELPPKALSRLAQAFRTNLESGLRELGFGNAGTEAYASPRRLAVRVRNLTARQPDRMLTRRGPTLQSAFDAAGNPTPAALGFARSCGVAVAELERAQTDKGAWLVHAAAVAGKTAVELVPGAVARALADLPIPRRMRWGGGADEFVRPVHWLLMIYGAEVVDAEILGVRSGRVTYGHRFHRPGPIVIETPGRYAEQLASEGRVIAGFDVRRARVRELVEACARDQTQGRAVIDDDLLEEVTALVEWPVALCGGFDAPFLDLPREVLVACMQGHQKYFPVEDPHGRLTNRFITVANLESTAPEVVRRGNERVIRPRLGDAAFFWSKDRQTPLAHRLPRLGAIVFEARLGSLLAKTERITALARLTGAAWDADLDAVARAATLSRCDLVTDMVGEFPELQGIMGGYYAHHDGEPEAVSHALREFYLPRFAGDAIPQTAVGRAIAVADKLDTLIAIFGIGAEPSGDRDPYALRRAALGIVRIIVETGVDLDLGATLTAAAALHGEAFAADVAARVCRFVIERLRGYYLEAGAAPDIVDAVLATGSTNPGDIDRCIAAVRVFRTLPEAAALAAANKRIANLLRKSGGEAAAPFDTVLLVEPAELALAVKLAAVEAEIEPLFERREYTGYLERLASVRAEVDAFFDAVMVLCEDAALRRNRLALLTRMYGLFTRVADVSRISI